MKYTVGHVGRSVVARLDDGDPIYESIERIAATESIRSGVVLIIGGVTNAGVIVGPERTDVMPPVPVMERISEAHEIVGVGMLFPDNNGYTKLHMHAALGRGRNPVVGCPREGADCWLVNEVVILELTEIDAARLPDEVSGFSLLSCSDV